MEKCERIRQLNDNLRRSGTGGTVLLTQGVQAQKPAVIQSIITAVQTFSNFSADNDPYGEHEFGAFEVKTLKLFWKIDYYDRSMTAGARDPSDPSTTKRVLTIMLREEY
jgi:hypothetical protein